jgi:SAM-dependent methyltransferase
MDLKALLDESAKSFDVSQDFDSVMAHYDVTEIKPHLKGKFLVELGSNAATVTQQLLPLAKQLDIVEGSKIAIDRTKQELGDDVNKVNLYHSLWEEFTPKRKYSDIIFVRGLEHMLDPVDFLSDLKHWLLPGGRVHIIVPNSPSLHRMVMVQQGQLKDLYELRDRDFQVGHQRIYDKSTLIKHVTQSGMNVVECRGFFLKQVSTPQMGQIAMRYDHPFVMACYEAGKILPEYGTQLYLIAENNE